MSDIRWLPTLHGERLHATDDACWSGGSGRWRWIQAKCGAIVYPEKPILVEWPRCSPCLAIVEREGM